METVGARGQLLPTVAAQLVLVALWASAEGGYWDEPAATYCRDPEHVESDREWVVKESDLALWGHVRTVRQENTSLTVRLKLQDRRGFWYFGSPNNCCRENYYDFTFRKSAASEALGCLVPEGRSVGASADMTKVGFFLRAYHNYTLLLPSSLAMKRELIDELGREKGTEKRIPSQQLTCGRAGVSRRVRSM